MINGLLVQIFMLATAIGLALFYVKPTFTTIGSTQDMILEYQAETQKVEAVNRQLAGFMTTVNEIPADSMRLLTDFIPDTINHVEVARDIFYIGEKAGVSVPLIDYSGVKTILSETGEISGSLRAPTPHVFVLKVEGSYYDFKQFLALLEKNKYPLLVQSLDVTTDEDGSVMADLEVVTYSHLSAEEVVTN